MRPALLLLLLVAVAPATAKIPLRVCKETCTSLVASDCADLPGTTSAVTRAASRSPTSTATASSTSPSPTS